MTSVLLCLSLIAANEARVTPYDIDPLPHVVTTLGLYTVLGVYQGLVRPSLPGGLACRDSDGPARCDPQDLSVLDRRAVHNDSDAWMLTSDVTLGVMIGGIALADALDTWQSQKQSLASSFWGDFGTDALVIVETAAIANALAHIFKFAFRRPRPTQYREGRGVGSIENQLSFPSGHATAAAALATAYGMTFALKHPNSPWRYVLWPTLASMVLLTGEARVAGGFHFHSDILAGVALGTTVGFLMPYALRRRSSTVSVLPSTLGGVGGQILVRF
ncbi:MAG: phosphatase PAP2 family protein [Myxococcota bacterium]